MKAIRIHRFGGIDAIVEDDIARPTPAAGEVLVRIGAAGVGPWDAWIRAGKSALPQPLPLTLGADIAGVVEALGPGVTELKVGDAVFGVSNGRFTDGYAEYSAAAAAMLSHRPQALDDIAACSLPVVGVTAWQMLFERARLTRGRRVLVHGAGGSVGRCVVQLGRSRNLHVIANAAAAEQDELLALGADEVIDARSNPLQGAVSPVDAVIDLVGGTLQDQSFATLKPGGILVSAVSPPDQAKAAQHGVRATFFLVDVNATCLARLAAMVDAGTLKVFVGDVLPLAQAPAAHEMLDGTRVRRKGKIVLDVAGQGA